MTNSKLYIKNYSGKKVPIILEVQQYAKNGQIAILLYNSRGESYGALSVFIVPFKYENYMAVDTNNLPNAEEFIQEYNLGTLVGYTQSGFCTYPIYEMDLDELGKYDEGGVDRLIKDNMSDISE